MKLNLKSIVAAVAMAVASTSSMASIQNGTAFAAGGSELFFVAYDATAGIKSSYIKDLGVTFNQFLTTPTYSVSGSLNVSSDANWNTYVSNVGGSGNLGNTRWAVVGNLQNATIGINNSQGSKLLVTAAVGAVVAGSNLQIAASAGEINTVFLPDFFDASAVGVNNSYVFSASDVTPKNWSNIEQTNINSNLPFSIVNQIGAAANFHQLVRSSNRSTTAGTVSTVLSTATSGYQWQFDGATVFAAPIPEPETYGMLLAGLALIGTVARRRRAA